MLFFSSSPALREICVVVAFDFAGVCRADAAAAAAAANKKSKYKKRTFVKRLGELGGFGPAGELFACRVSTRVYGKEGRKGERKGMSTRVRIFYLREKRAMIDELNR